LTGQELRISSPQPLSKELRKELNKLSGEFSDSIDLIRRVYAAERIMQSHGFLLSEGELLREDENYLLKIETGPLLYAREISVVKPKDLIIPERTAVPDRKRPLMRGEVSQLAEEELQFLENHGYPFARIKVSSFDIENDSAAVVYQLNPGPRVSIDSIVVKGFDGFPDNFLRYDLELRKGMPYNEQLLDRLPLKTARIEYLRMSRKPALAFTRSKTILYLYLEEVRGNQVDGVVGINTTETGEVTFNGDFHLRLLNTLKKGENFELRWRRPDQNIQSFDLNLGIPYLIHTPIGLQGNLSIFRQDSSFVNTNFQGLLTYLLESASFISAGINLRSSNVLNDNDGLGFNSFSATFYKLGIDLNRTNRVIVPTRGYQWRASGSTGQRRSGDLNQDQYRLEFFGNYYTGIKRHVLAFGVQSEALFGDELFLNEVYRIGGLKTLRGFNEQSIFSSAYTIGTLEYRFMIGEFDYLAIFSDVAWSETNTVNEYASNLFTGVGAGINFNTAGGIFSLFFALGKEQETSFDLRTTKVHFGYISRF
jgi:outer membrane protein assembly factor BamA